MRALLGYGLLGLLAFLSSLLLRAPATLVADAIGARLPGFSAQVIEGSVTDGLVQGVRWRDVHIERITWRWRPLALLTGRLVFQLEADDPELKLTVSSAMSLNRQLHFQDLSGRLPLAQLGAFIGRPKSPLQGVLELDLREMDFNTVGQPLTATGVARVRELRALLGQGLNIGDFTMHLTSTRSEGIQGVLKDDGGPLMLDGALRLALDGRYRFNGQAAVRDAGNQPLRRAMSLLGPPDGDGRWTLSFSGVLTQ